MTNYYFKKRVFATIIVALITILVTMPIFSSMREVDSILPNHQLNEEDISAQTNWYWKEPYPNYAPHKPGGMPDFDQRQKQWKAIFPGINGILESTVVGDDVISTDGFRIGPGLNCRLESDPLGDDIIDWTFSGPAAVANCFWWFDSKYATSTGVPGDGNDIFTLIEDYGVGDDHQKENVPELIERLALEMDTCSEGTTDIDIMQDAIDNWFLDTGLSSIFEENTYDLPTFTFIENEIERSQDVILKLGFYDAVAGSKLVDQEQTIFDGLWPLGLVKWWDFQSFTPMVNRLDAIQLLLDSGTPAGPPCDIEINVYDSLFDPIPLGTARLNPGALGSFTWVQFHFIPYIQLTPGATYYFDVRQVSASGTYNWWFIPVEGAYVPGQGWMAGAITIPGTSIKFDWCFKTEYFDPPLTWWKKGQRYVTCAGVNSQWKLIALSDPYQDKENPTNLDHNDAQYVSHDIYVVKEYNYGLPGGSQWYLHEYFSGSQASINITVVEKAVVICPIGAPEPDLECGGSLSWSNVKPGSVVTGTFSVRNDGDPGSKLNWEITDYPDWGTWSFTPSNGSNLAPSDGPISINVTVEAPPEKQKDFTGNVTVQNTDEATDFCNIQISLSTPKKKIYDFLFDNFIERFYTKFPFLLQLFSYFRKNL